MSDDEKRGPRLVSSIDEKAIRKARTDDELAASLRLLASNLIRITRGAGKPHLVGQQAAGLINAIEAYHAAHWYWPVSERIQGALSVRREFLSPDHPEEELHVMAVDKIVRGALQIAASRLAGQATQETLGERELFDGERLLRESRELRRKRWGLDK